MESCFTDSEKAVDWLVAELSNRCPDAELEVTLYPRKFAQTQHMKGNVNQVMTGVRRMLKNFPRVEVQAHPRNVYGFFTIFICACDSETFKQCPLKCQDYAERPKVTIIASPNRQAEGMVGSCNVMPLDAGTAIKDKRRF